LMKRTPGLRFACRDSEIKHGFSNRARVGFRFGF